MTRDPTTTAVLVEKLFAGCPEAARVVFDKYSHQLLRLAQQHLSRKVAVRADAEDVVQSAFRTFFRRGLTGAFQIDSSEKLWRLLVTITLRKARSKARFHTAGVRAVTAEQPETEAAEISQAWSREPSPDDATMLAEQIEALLKDLPQSYREVLDRRLQGEPVAQIAGEMQVSRQTVYRVLDLLQQRLEQT
jgi:RNA polymerase sigma-70 factor (ECF subfamily)